MNSILNINMFFKLKTSNKHFVKKVSILILLFLTLFHLIQPISFANTASFAKNNYSRASMDRHGNIYMKENLYNRVYPASLTKVAITILAIEKLDLNEKITLGELQYPIPFDYVTTPTYVGETLTVEDLLYATMLKSANDAPSYIAQRLFSSPKEFQKGINEYLKSIGLLDTNFTNPFGLEDKNHYTTPFDLLTLTSYAMKNYIFRNIVYATEYTIPFNSFSPARKIKTTSLFAYRNSAVFNIDFHGIKTGFTEQAGDCLITTAKVNQTEFYFLYTGAESTLDKFIKTQEMYTQTDEFFTTKGRLDEYTEQINKTKILGNINLSKISSQLFFSTFDKVIFILFVILLFVLFGRLGISRKRKKTKSRKVRQNVN